MWIPLWICCFLVYLFPGEAWKLYSSASVKGFLLVSGIAAQGSNLDDMGLDSPPAPPHGSSNEGMEVSLASEWTRVEGTYGLWRPLHGENLVYIHRQTTQRMAIAHESWEPISVSREEFPDLILEDVALFFAAMERSFVVGMQNPPCLCCLSPAYPQRSQLCGCDGKGL